MKRQKHIYRTFGGGGWLDSDYHDKSLDWAEGIELGARMVSLVAGMVGKAKGGAAAMKGGGSSVGANVTQDISSSGAKAQLDTNMALTAADMRVNSPLGKLLSMERLNNLLMPFAYGGSMPSHLFAGGGKADKISAWADIAADSAALYKKNALINEAAVNQSKNTIKNAVSASNSISNTNSFDSLMNNQANQVFSKNNYTRNDFQGEKTWKKVMRANVGSVQTSMKGFQATGNWVGAVIGGVMGLAGGLSGGIRAKRQARRQARIANRFATAANSLMVQRTNDRALALREKQNRNLLRSFVAEGGFLNFGQDMNKFGLGGFTGGAIDYANTLEYLNNYRLVGMAKAGNMLGNLGYNMQAPAYTPQTLNIGIGYAFGGNLGTNGTDFTDGLTYFNVPTRHETNPNGGIPQGIAPDGRPNLVEGKEEDKKGDGGEIKWNEQSYIFSDRLTPSLDLIDRWKLPKSFLEYTYADVVRNSAVVKEAEERPNDPMSLKTMDKFLADVAEDQEKTKQEKEAAEMQEEVANMSDDELLALGALMQQQLAQLAEQLPQEIMENPVDYALLGQLTQEEYAQDQAIQLLVAAQEGMQQPLVRAEGGTLATDELEANMEELPNTTNPFTGGLAEPEPQEALNIEDSQLVAPATEETKTESEQNTVKPAEEMSTKELNQAIEDILEYAKEIKDRQLIREAKKIKKASREDKEEFVDSTYEEMQEYKAEQALEMSAQLEQSTEEPTAEQSLVSPEEMAAMQQSQEGMFAEGGGLPVDPAMMQQLMPMEEAAMQQLAMQNPSMLAEPLMQLTPEQLAQEDLSNQEDLTQLEKLGESLGLEEDAQYTPEEIAKLRKKAEELGIQSNILNSTDDDTIALLLNEFIQSRVLAEQALEQPMEEQQAIAATQGMLPGVAQEIPQGFAEGGPLFSTNVNNSIFQTKVNLARKLRELEASIPPLPTTIEEVDYNAEQLLKQLEANQIRENLLSNIQSSLPLRKNRLFATGGSMSLNNPNQHVYAGDVTDEELAALIQERREEVPDNLSGMSKYLYDTYPNIKAYYDKYGEFPQAVTSALVNTDLGENVILEYLLNGKDVNGRDEAIKTYLDTFKELDEKGYAEDELIYLKSLKDAIAYKKYKTVPTSTTTQETPSSTSRSTTSNVVGGKSVTNDSEWIHGRSWEDYEAPLGDPNNNIFNLSNNDAKSRYEAATGTSTESNNPTGIEDLTRDPNQFSLLNLRTKVRTNVGDRATEDFTAIRLSPTFMNWLKQANPLVAEVLLKAGVDMTNVDSPVKSLIAQYGAEYLRLHPSDKEFATQYRDYEFRSKHPNLYTLEGEEAITTTKDNIQANINAIAEQYLNLPESLTEENFKHMTNAEKLQALSTIDEKLADLFKANNPTDGAYPNTIAGNKAKAEAEAAYNQKLNQALIQMSKGRNIKDMNASLTAANPKHHENWSILDNPDADENWTTGAPEYDWSTINWGTNPHDVLPTAGGKYAERQWGNPFTIDGVSYTASEDGTTALLNYERSDNYLKQRQALMKLASSLFDENGKPVSDEAAALWKSIIDKITINEKGEQVTDEKLLARFTPEGLFGKDYRKHLNDTPEQFKDYMLKENNGSVFFDEKEGAAHFTVGTKTPKSQKLYAIKGDDGKLIYFNPSSIKLEELAEYNIGPEETRENSIGTSTYQLLSPKNNPLFFEVTPDKKSAPESKKKEEPLKDKLDYGKALNNMLRYAPLFNEPFLNGYSSARGLADSANNLIWTAAPRHGEYLKYNPVDSLYRMNQIQQALNNTLRGIFNAANGNIGTLMNNLALNRAKYQEERGKTALDIDTENWNRQKDTIAQHNQVDQAYDLLAMQADSANMGNNQYLVAAALKAADRNYEIENSNNTSRSQALADKLGLLNKIGTENNMWDRYYEHKRWLGLAAEGGSLVIKRKQRKRYS